MINRLVRTNYGSNIVCVLALLVFGTGVTWLVARPMLLSVYLALPIVLLSVLGFIYKPTLIIWCLLAFSFLTSHFGRLSGAPLGTFVDALLVFGIFFNIAQNVSDSPFKVLHHRYLYAWLIWMAWVVLELFNPLAPGFQGWIYAMRGVGLYCLLTVALGLMLINDHGDFKHFLGIWACFSVLASFWGFKQLYVGLMPFEEQWLALGAAQTHLLSTGLRVFSFYSDAGQFGAAQGHALVVFGVLCLGPFSMPKKISFAIVAVISMWGMFVSGTRGALFVPISGFLTYLFLTKKTKVLILGLAVLAMAFVFLKYTFILQGVPQVSRMRSALDPNDASLQVRFENQQKLANYLSDKPIGGGIGSAGYWGLRFSPGTFLAETATDSWYVQIWAENGWVGLTLYLALLGYLTIDSGLRIRSLRNKRLKYELMALHAGMVGILVASYGNKILGQFPTSIIIYLSIVFMAKKLSIKQDTT